MVGTLYSQKIEIASQVITMPKNDMRPGRHSSKLWTMSSWPVSRTGKFSQASGCLFLKCTNKKTQCTICSVFQCTICSFFFLHNFPCKHIYIYQIFYAAGIKNSIKAVNEAIIYFIYLTFTYLGKVFEAQACLQWTTHDHVCVC